MVTKNLDADSPVLIIPVANDPIPSLEFARILPTLIGSVVILLPMLMLALPWKGSVTGYGFSSPFLQDIEPP
jgi:hypothetical protein